MKLGEYCTTSFFTALAGAIGQSDCASFIDSNAYGLHLNILLNYNSEILTELNDTNSVDIASQLIAPKYGDTLIRIYNALLAEYNPLANTDVTTTESIEHTGQDSKIYNTSFNRTGTDSLNRTGNDKVESDITLDNTASSATTYDDTSNYKPVSKDEHVYDGENKTTYNSTDTTTFNTVDSHTGTDSGTNAYNDDKTTHRVGNIGITPNQRLIQYEMDLRLRNRFFDYISAFLVETLSSGLWEIEE